MLLVSFVTWYTHTVLIMIIINHGWCVALFFYFFFLFLSSQVRNIVFELYRHNLEETIVWSILYNKTCIWKYKYFTIYYIVKVRWVWTIILYNLNSIMLIFKNLATIVRTHSIGLLCTTCPISREIFILRHKSHT